MKIAILSVSKKGYNLSINIKNKLDKDSKIIKCDLFYKDVKKNLNLIFNEYDAIIAIMASGILIRSIANLIESKVSDPAVLNIDENGDFVISTLSGHLGGANSLTQKIANLIDATPVITTATDVNKKLGIDVIAKDLYLTIDNVNEILPINKAILNGEEISFTINSDGNYEYLTKYLNEVTLEINVSIYYSSKVNKNEIRVNYSKHELTLKPRNIIVGIGCRRGKKCDEIEKLLNISLLDLNILKSRINGLASAEIKKDEKGILDLANKLDLNVNFVEMDKLKLFKSNYIQKSKFVKSKFGIDNVCESSALITAGYDSRLIYKKTAYDGVTIAIAISK